MKGFIILLILNTCITLQVNGQELNRKMLRGTYTRSSGEAGRTIQKNDSSYISLLPITYSLTTLKLKRLGRSTEITKAYHGMNIDSKFKGKWHIEVDTLIINYKGYEERYLIDRSIDEKLFLNSMAKDRIIYSKKND